MKLQQGCSRRGISRLCKCCSCHCCTPSAYWFLGLIAFSEIGEFFMTASLWEFIGVGFLGYLFALVLPFASLLWVMMIKLFMGGHIYKNNVTPGVYPKWSRMHLRVWRIGRLEKSVLRPLGTMFRSAPLMAYVLRRLGATVGDNLQCAHDVVFSGLWTYSLPRTMSPSRLEPMFTCRGGWGRICILALFTSRAAARSACEQPFPTM